jgi:prepilin-type N-terminal cleavage/methylation domain-containing protein
MVKIKNNQKFKVAVFIKNFFCRLFQFVESNSSARMSEEWLGKRGFTMIELAIATSILAIIFGGMTIFGVQVIKGNQRTQELKNTVENVSYAIEFINKSVRTSHKVIQEDGGKKLFIIDNETEKSYCYFFDESNNQLKRKSGGDSAGKCEEITGDFVTLAGDEQITVTGEFKVKETKREGENKTRGFVRTRIEIENEDDFSNQQDDKMIIQSSVSLRDYGFDYHPKVSSARLAKIVKNLESDLESLDDCYSNGSKAIAWPYKYEGNDICEESPAYGQWKEFGSDVWLSIDQDRETDDGAVRISISGNATSIDQGYWIILIEDAEKNDLFDCNFKNGKFNGCVASD